ncbi:MAG TPA: zinc-ribbon domain-containing protein [Dermatophilaceae bacterium]|nr:zinc-ribbon domain-containing protein [Dermatophilaceae bacterium]
MLILGFSAKDTLLATLLFVCGHCGVNAPHQLVKRARRFTLFFIPVLPVGTKYLDTCTACGHVIDVPRGQAEAALAQGR